MNYRHAFHAGNVADVLKHAMLARILTYLIKKPTPVRFIDTHAGAGRYDLGGPEAGRTGEWQQGIARVLDAEAPPQVRHLLAPYLDAIGPRADDGRPGSYPGSPAVAQHILRRTDRLLLCEMHPVEAAALLTLTKGDRRVRVMSGDGYLGLKASVPPPERRGLVLIDPPFEDRAEFDKLLAAFADAHRRWPTGCYALWYLIKDGAPVAAFLRGLRALRVAKMLEVELHAPASPARGTGLRGSGLVIVNPPYTLRDEARILLAHFAACFARIDETWHWRADASEGLGDDPALAR